MSPAPSGPPIDFPHVLDVVRAAAAEASTILLGGFRHRRGDGHDASDTLVVEHKGAIDLVTKYDRESEALLRDRLTTRLRYAVIGEENGGAGPSSPEEPVFYVDPLDGTTNFIHGHPFWAVSIGLCVSGQPVFGLVLAPPLGIEWSGWVGPDGGLGHTLRRSAPNAFSAGTSSALVEAPCHVSRNDLLGDAMLATGFPYDRRTSPENNFAEFTRIKLRAQAIRRCGSAAIDLCLVSEGTYDGYWEQKLSPWDVAAGIAIVRAAGGTATDYDGGTSCIASGRVVASNGRFHDELLTEISTARRERRERDERLPNADRSKA